MSQSISRFVLTDEGTVIDNAHRFPLSPACQCGCCPESNETELNKQIYLRRFVLDAQLSALSKKVESLCEPEARSLVQVIYETVYVSKLDWTLGQVVNNFSAGPHQSADALHDLSPISVFVDEVAVLLRDLYGDCNQHLLDTVLEAIRIIAFQWDRARTASSRDFFERLSEQVNILVRPLSATLVPDGLTSASETLKNESAASGSIRSQG